ncbi:MAG: ATP-binding protein [Oscillospiraceae bacterium]|nr:ATP-binding protein [Oscillospiraceae bacterium]
MTLLPLDFVDSQQTAELREDEYWDGDRRLIYCTTCHTPRQQYLVIAGNRVRLRCMCACQEKASEGMKKDREHWKFLNRVAQNRAVGLTDPELQRCTFENDLGYNKKQMDIARRYVQNWEDFRENSVGLLLWGGVGTGKSYIAGCIANALLDKGVPVMMTNFPRVLNKLTDMYSGDRTAYIDSLKSFQLLVVDDLGVERNTEFVIEQVYHIVDSRYRSHLPLIVTTNLSIKETKSPEDLAKKRIYDRILERCAAVQVNDQNIREINKRINMEKAAKLLIGGENEETEEI